MCIYVHIYAHPLTYIHRYGGGTVCDVTGQPRSLEVHFKCATDSLNVIASIKEKSTCKYVLNFYTPLICNHPQFQPKHDIVRSIECYPVAQQN
jgi:protein OS-9